MRSFQTPFEQSFLNSMQNGVLSYTYKGVLCRKCPLDMAIYTKLIWDLKPATLIEVGTLKGGTHCGWPMCYRPRDWPPGSSQWIRICRARSKTPGLSFCRGMCMTWGRSSPRQSWRGSRVRFS